MDSRDKHLTSVETVGVQGQMGFLLASQTVKSVKKNDYDLVCH